MTHRIEGGSKIRDIAYIEIRPRVWDEYQEVYGRHLGSLSFTPTAVQPMDHAYMQRTLLP